MAPPAPKANYKSYETISRLLRAVVAAHPDQKWNYKAIAECFGSDMTEHALNHRFRIIRAHSELIRLGLQAGFDMKNLQPDGPELPRTIEGIDKNNIAKYFGQSTPDGIRFQFQSIKQDADSLRKNVDAGGDVNDTLSNPMTPSGKTTGTPRKTPNKSRTGAGSTTSTPRVKVASTPSKTRKRAVTPINNESEDDQGVSDNYSEMDTDTGKDPVSTPKASKNPVLSGRVAKTPRAARTPTRSAAKNAATRIAAVSQETGSESDVSTTNVTQSRRGVSKTVLVDEMDTAPTEIRTLSRDIFGPALSTAAAQKMDETGEDFDDGLI